ncbi:MAG: NADH-quinone oxidoreductase subunit N [Deltaproteobacteria bacterium]|jgi:NADH-quinone oxidoreductase subunit N|nr:NADH-quinone oxidoreductase subunit N [Deltaproteobacteria bacterium]
MNDLNFQWAYLGPETVFFSAVLLLFLAAIIQNKAAALSRALVRGVPVLAALGSASLAAASVTCPQTSLFFEAYQVDGLSQFFKLLVSAGYLVACLNAWSPSTLADYRRADYFLFLTLSAWGLIILASAAELVTVYLALELASYSLYILIPIRSHSKEAAEAGLKYILFGAVATALALYGLSWIIAAQHTTYIKELASCDFTMANPLAVLGLSLFLGGLFFKLALFPFHFWCPDVYQGAGNETAAYAATLPKMGAVIVLIRLAALISPGQTLANILAVLAAVSITYGNLAALAQKDLKRMLGFSSVAHAGYILVGLVSKTPEGLAAAAFYAMAYLVMNLLVFWIISRISDDGRNLTYDSLNGLAKRSPALALALAAGAFSLVGLPPTVGFIGKLWLLTSAWGHGYDWLVIVVCVNSAIAIFYYLSLVRHAYTEEPAEGSLEEAAMARANTSAFSQLGALALGLLVILLGVLPSPVFGVILEASRQLLPL